MHFIRAGFLLLRSHMRSRVSLRCRLLLYLCSAALALFRSMMTAFPWTMTRRAFWAFVIVSRSGDLGAEASDTGGFLLPLDLGVPLWFCQADVLLAGISPPTVSALSSPCIWARPSQFAWNWTFCLSEYALHLGEAVSVYISRATDVHR